VGRPRRRRYPLHLVLFLATLVTTTLAGAGWPPDLGRGLLYGVPLMLILLSHEMGHYVMCRRYGVPASLPYFIPFPLSLFGTLGAVIRMRGIAYGRRALFDIGIAGPLAGLAVALPVTYWGLRLSRVVPEGEMPPGTLTLGEPILFRWLTRMAWGGSLGNADLILHPAAFAGWAGFFVTALNLLPVGQLDGGHVAHALLPRRSHLVGWATVGVLGIAALRFPGWSLLLLLVLLLGVRHPPVAAYEPLGPGRILLGLLGMVLFVLTFTPQPFGQVP
jgi:membrane-associated protease RseP (regulator of RpoE activity)